MVVSPIEYRYGRSIVKDIFSEENRLKVMLRVEAAVARAESDHGLIPGDAYPDIDRAVRENSVSLQRVKEIESEINHDVMAVVRALSEQCPVGGRYVHFGITSNDINDTATSIQMKTFNEILLNDLSDIMVTMIGLVKKYRDLPMLGRTHGQHASPITFGLKISVYLSEMSRHLDRIIEASKRAFAGKVSGPVGTGSSLGRDALKIQAEVMEYLGIYPEEGATQIVDRDRYIEYLSVLNGISVTMEKIGTEIRNLQRPEIDEVSEYFDFEKQVGSSSMPSKVNPVNSENVVSIARLIRSFIIPEYEAGVTWHERDLTNSALERFTIPYSCILTDHILTKMNGILSKLIVKEENIIKNLLSDESVVSENIVSVLTENGVPRQDAHELVRKASMKARTDGISFRESLEKTGIERYIDPETLEASMNPENLTGRSSEICDKIVYRAENDLKRIKMLNSGSVKQEKRKGE